MKGKKMVIAVILALIVCLVLIPTCAFATGEDVANDDTGGQPPEIVGTTENDTDTDDANAQGKDDNDEGEVPDSGDNSEDKELEDEGSDGKESKDGDKESSEESEGSGEENQDTNTEGSTPLQPKSDDGFKVGVVYEGNTYEMTNLKGGEKHSLADVLAYFSITDKIDEASIDKVGVLDLEDGENGWELITNSAFNDKYTLTVWANGKPYTFTVYDDNTAKEVASGSDVTEALKNNAVTTIKLTQSFTLDDVLTVEASREITIDLNGYTLTNAANKHTIWNKGKLIIEDSSADKTGTVDNVSHGRAALVNEGTAILNGGNFTRSAEAGKTHDNNGGNSYYNIKNLGTMTINDGVDVRQDGHYSSLIANGWFNYKDKGESDLGVAWTSDKTAKLTIEGGTFSGGLYVVKNDDYGYVTIENGKFSNKDDGVILNTNIAKINGGTFTGTPNVGMIYNWKASTSGANEGSLAINGGTFDNKKLISVNAGGTIAVTGGYYTDSNILTLVSDMLVVEYGDLYAIGDDASDLAAYAADEGDAINVVAIDPADNKVTGIPAGVTFVNNSKYSIFVNGVEVKPGATYTVPAPVVEPAEVLQPTTEKKTDTIVEAKKDNATEQTSVTVEGTTAKITVTDDKGELIAPQEVTIKSVTALESTGATEASIQLDTKLVLDLDVATIKSAGTSDVVTVTNEDSVITVKSGETALVSVDVKAVLSETEQTVTVKFSENTVKVICGDTAYSIDLSELGDVGTLTLKLENGVLKVYDKDGNLLKEIEKA